MLNFFPASVVKDERAVATYATGDVKFEGVEIVWLFVYGIVMILGVLLILKAQIYGGGNDNAV